MLNTSISVSEKMAEIGDPKHILVMTWTLAHLDKNGVFYAAARKVKGAVVPIIDEISVADCQDAIAAAERVGLIRVFEHDGQLYQVWPGFLDNQRGLHVERERTILPEVAGNFRQLPATSGKLRTNRREEKGTELNGREAESAQARTATPPAPVIPPPSTSQTPDHDNVATATPAIPDAMRTQKAPPRKGKPPKDDLSEHDDPRVAAYLEILRPVITDTNARLICQRVSQEHLAEWRDVLVLWATSEWRATNFSGMFERYDAAVNGARARHLFGRPAAVAQDGTYRGKPGMIP